MEIPMAQIKQSLVNAVVQGQRNFATVGNNRVFRRDKNTITGYLHMHPIVVLSMDDEGTWNITLNPCGWRTTTTRAAMKDFLQALGIKAGISFAKGSFSARLFLEGQWVDLRETANGAISFSKSPAQEGKAIF